MLTGTVCPIKGVSACVRTYVSHFFSFFRCKVYNTVQLMIFIAEIFDGYMKKRLIDVAKGRRRTKNMSLVRIFLEVVTPLGNGKYKVTAVYCRHGNWLLRMQSRRELLAG